MDTTVTIRDLQARGLQHATPRAVTISPEALEGREGTIIAQQGDIYVWFLATMPHGCIRRPRTDGQLAPGMSQGARHCVDPRHAVLWEVPVPTALDGPIIEARETCTITHPEHGHIVLPPGLYRVTYQRQYATELRRIAD